MEKCGNCFYSDHSYFRSNEKVHKISHTYIHREWNEAFNIGLCSFFFPPALVLLFSLQLQLCIGSCIGTVQCYVPFGIKRGANASSSSSSSLKPEKFYGWLYTFWPFEACKGEYKCEYKCVRVRVNNSKLRIKQRMFFKKRRF